MIKFHISLSKLSLRKTPNRSCPVPSLQTHTHSIISACFSLPTSSKRLLGTRTDTPVYTGFRYNRRGHENCRMCSWRSFTYSWAFTMSLKSSYTGIQTLLKVLYTPFQPIYPFVVLNKSSVTVTSRALKVTNKRDITYLLIRSGGISLSRLLQPFRPPVENITPLPQR